MKIRKLPSGSYNVQIQINGKRKSFTAKTEAELRALVRSHVQTRSGIARATLGELIDSYIASKENVLSPSTINGYKQIRAAYLPDLMTMQAEKITSEMLQFAVNELSADHSPKTVRNIIGLIIATIKTYHPDIHLSVTYPPKRRQSYNVPTTSEVFRMINAASEPLKTAIMLAAFCGLRRSEIIPLQASDLSGDLLHIHSAAVYDSDGLTVIKQPKTYQSDRFVTVPDIVLAHIAPLRGQLCPMGLSTLTRQFVALRRSLGLSCRFHDLRHYYASFQHAIGVPDAYIMQSGGWNSDGILKSIYRNTLDDERLKNNDLVNAYLSSVNGVNENADKCDKFNVPSRVRAPLRPDKKRAARSHRKTD